MLRICVVALLAGTAFVAHANESIAPVVAWEVQVVKDGQTVDTFRQQTTVGQTRTDTHDLKPASAAGCGNAPALSRSVTVAPLFVDGDTIGLSIDAQETMPDAASQAPACSGASLRQIVASDPLLDVHASGGWTDWTLVDSDPRLVYRVRAHVVD